ncbi:hypothetical protein F4680DRAFT_465646 [Xylaria scruposa]|nr:hypothetical protein F4680DRAFT_465646 [Xylaria scruposa]
MQQQGRGYYSYPNAYGAYPPPQQRNFNQWPQYSASMPQTPAAMAFPGVLELFFFRDENDTQIVKAAGQADAFLVLTLPVLDKPEITVRRSHASGEAIATARLHDFTTTKADMTLWGRHERWKKEYSSFTGLGYLCWQPYGEMGFILEQDGRMLARYSVNGDVQKRSNKKSWWSLTMDPQLALLSGSSSSSDGPDQEAEARLEIFAQGLSREQLEEIVVSCTVERERLAKNMNNKRDVKIINELLGGEGDMSGA